MRFQTFSIIAGTAACNAKCPFCISRMTGRNVGYPAEINWRNFDKSCRLAQINNITNVLITGKGEPTLYPDQISDYLKHLKKFNFPIIELQTNALLFDHQKEKYQPYLIEWQKLGLTFISISIVHYDPEKNREIYVPGLKKYMDLKKLTEWLHRIGYSVRLSCTMIKGYIDDEISTRKMIESAGDWGAEQLTLRQVAFPNDSKDEAVKAWTIKHSQTIAKLKKINDMLESDGRRLMTFDYGGVVYDYQGINVALSNALTINPNSEEIRQIIFFPDGHLRYDWQYRGAILF